MNLIVARRAKRGSHVHSDNKHVQRRIHALTLLLHIASSDALPPASAVPLALLLQHRPNSTQQRYARDGGSVLARLVDPSWCGHSDLTTVHESRFT